MLGRPDTLLLLREGVATPDYIVHTHVVAAPAVHGVVYDNRRGDEVRFFSYRDELLAAGSYRHCPSRKSERWPTTIVRVRVRWQGNKSPKYDGRVEDENFEDRAGLCVGKTVRVHWG